MENNTNANNTNNALLAAAQAELAAAQAELAAAREELAEKASALRARVLAVFARGYVKAPKWVKEGELPSEEEVDRAETPASAGWRRRHAERLERAFRQTPRSDRELAAYLRVRAAEAAVKSATPRLDTGEPWGNSYFGSGGATSTIHKMENLVAENGDNGFVRGPRWVTPADPNKAASFIATSSDGIGKGRKWRIDATWTPGKGWSVK